MESYIYQVRRHRTRNNPNGIRSSKGGKSNSEGGQNINTVEMPEPAPNYQTDNVTSKDKKYISTILFPSSIQPRINSINLNRSESKTPIKVTT